MKLYFAPGTCAIGIRVMLEEIGKPFDAYALNFAAREQYAPAFTALNPKSKVPTLQRDDGSVLTEFGSIAIWLARTNPDANLLPSDPESEARANEMLEYVIATVHMRGFSRIFVPANFSTSDRDHEAVQIAGRGIVAKGFEVIAKALGGRPFVADSYSYADAALFYVEHWARVREPITLPQPCVDHYQRMLQRPAFRRAIAADAEKQSPRVATTAAN